VYIISRTHTQLVQFNEVLQSGKIPYICLTGMHKGRKLLCTKGMHAQYGEKLSSMCYRLTEAAKDEKRPSCDLEKKTWVDKCLKRGTLMKTFYQTVRAIVEPQQYNQQKVGDAKKLTVWTESKIAKDDHRNNERCDYFLSRGLAGVARVNFMTYAMLMETLGVNSSSNDDDRNNSAAFWEKQNTILVMDEVHNLPQIIQSKMEDLVFDRIQLKEAVQSFSNAAIEKKCNEALRETLTVKD
jgi:Rad3-related DNA helicase